jgi:GNAT superfamily N-acetyltransferase
MTTQIREYRASDSIPEITALLHRAYARLAKMGMRFHASHQDDAITLRRLTGGKSFLAVDGDVIVGTISVYPSKADSPALYYRQAGVFHFGQFAVDPAYQGQGLGKQLYKVVEDYCRDRKATALALDTSEKAGHLIALYEKWGFKIVDRIKWDITNYASVIMSKPL